MSKFQATQLIRKEDLAARADAKGLPAWVDALIEPLNQFMDTVAVALKNGLTLDDNFSGVSKDIEFTHNVELTVDPQTTRTIVGVIPLTSGALRIENFGFRFTPTTTRQVAVTINFYGGSSTTKGVCRLFIFTK